MLEHQTTPTEQPQSSANVRVTPEELAKALAAIEAHKEQSVRETAGTIAIGEAVQQLGFDATPDEIWAEVQAQRQHQNQVVGKRLPRKTRRFLWLVLAACLVDLIGMRLTTTSDNTVSSVTTDSPAVQVIAPPAPQTIIKTLAEVPNNGTFYCDAATAQKLLQQSAQASQTLVTEGRPYTGQQNDASWTFTKHAGKLYIHGYIAPRSAGAIQLGHVPMDNVDVDATEAGGTNNSQAVTLPVGTFRVDRFEDDGMTKDIVISAIHPDQHFGDTW